MERDARLGGDARFDERDEAFPIDGERAAGGDGGLARRGNDQRIEPRELFFEQADGVLQRRAAQRVAADELGERAGSMRGPADHGAHLVKIHGDAAARRLPRGFAAGETAADNGQPFGDAQDSMRPASRLATLCVRSAAHWNATFPPRRVFTSTCEPQTGQRSVTTAIPRDEVALWIVGAAVKRAALLRAALHDRAAAFGTGRAGVFDDRLGGFALGVAAARDELAEAAGLDHHGAPAGRADFVGRFVAKLEPRQLLLAPRRARLRTGRRSGAGGRSNLRGPRRRCRDRLPFAR